MGWDSDQEERRQPDSATGRQYGETERESQDRQRKERFEYFQAGERKKQEGEFNRMKGGSSQYNDLGLPGKKTFIAKLILIFGFLLIGLGLTLISFEIQTGQMFGISTSKLIIIIGASCLIFIYLFQLVMFILTIFAVFFLWYQGSRNADGFILSTIPISAYLVSGGIILICYILRKILCQ
jgi:hypothetical protein